MNHLCNGGNLMNSCRITFKTTPVNVGIPWKMIFYPKRVDTLTRPPVLTHDEQFNRLVTGNMRPESSTTRATEIVNCTFT